MGEPTSRAAAVARRRRVAAAVGLAILLLGVMGGAGAMMTASDGAPTCDNPQTLDVQVAPELYSTVFQAARSVSQQGYVCATYNVAAGDGADTAARIKSGSSVPDVWIPDSSVWVDDVTTKLGNGWLIVDGTVATSPVAVAFPTSIRADAAQVGATWASAYSGVKRLSLQSTGESATSYVTMAAANAVDLDNSQRTQLLRAVVSLSRATMSPQTLQTKARLDAGQARAFPMSEQQMIAFNTSHAGDQLSAALPRQGAPTLDYPFVLPVRAGSDTTAATNALYSALTGGAGKTALAQAGFRVPGGQAPSGSPLPASFTALATPTRAQAVNAVRAWGDLAKDARMLVLIDVSGSMATKIDGSQTRIQLLSQTCVAALDALPQTTQIGVWVFSTDLRGKGNDYLPISDGIQSIGHTPAGDKYKADLVKKAKTVPIAMVKKNGDTALYTSILAAYRAASTSYDPNYINSVVVLTDGKDDVPKGHTISLNNLLGTLNGLYNPSKPVKIVTIGIGGDTDHKALSQIATATDGLSYTTTKPTDIANVFVDAFLHRG